MPSLLFDDTLLADDFGSFQPAIHRAGSAVYEVPQPVRSVRVLDLRSDEPLGLPLLGEVLLPAGTNVVVRGELPLPGGAEEPFEATLLEAVLALRAALDVEAGSTFDLYLQHDAVHALYRRLVDCAVTRFDWRLATHAAVAYTFVVHTTNRTVDDTAPA